MSSPARSAAARPARTTPARSQSTRSSSARTTTARPTTRAGAGRSSAARVRRPALSAAPEPRATVAGNGVFALIVVGILLTGMVLLLVLNTTLAQGAFQIGALTQTQNQLAVTEQQLLQDVAAEEAPEALQRRAGQLGMVPVTSPVFLRLADGAVLGTPTAAVAPRKHTAAPAAPSAPNPMTAVPETTTTSTTAKTAATKTAATKTTKPAAATKPATSTKPKTTAPTSDAAVPDPTSGAGR